MLTVGQAKKKGAVFVEGDVIEDPQGWTVRSDWVHSTSSWLEDCQVISFTDRKHTGDKKPCVDGLPIIVTCNNRTSQYNISQAFPWGYFRIKSWKPDLEALEKLANEKQYRKRCDEVLLSRGHKKEEKPIAEKQYTYELVTDLSTNEIAKAMIDGEVFYSEKGGFIYQWKNNGFHNGVHQMTGLNSLDFYRRKEIETITRTITYPKPVSNPLPNETIYWTFLAGDIFSEVWDGNETDMARLNQQIVHLTKENTQAHWDSFFGNTLNKK